MLNNGTRSIFRVPLAKSKTARGSNLAATGNRGCSGGMLPGGPGYVRSAGSHALRRTNELTSLSLS